MDNIKILNKIIDKFEKSRINLLDVEFDDIKVKLEKGIPMQMPEQQPVAVESVVSAIQSEERSEFIKSPLIGTFYAAASPESLPYVCVGQKVEKGRTVCLIEAMKMINEVPAPCDCVIESILVENGEVVDFEKPIFEIRV